MTELERLNELQTKREEAWNRYYNALRALTEKHHSILVSLNIGEAPLLPLGPEETVSLEGRDYANRFTWNIRKEIRFVNQDKDHPNRRDDFGSSFSLYINNNYISLNHGSCGEWTKEDKGQLSRLYLMAHIFEHEQEIIQELAPFVEATIPLKKEYNDLNNQINQIERDIENARRERERLATLALLKPGKYLCKKGSHWKYAQLEEGRSLSYEEYHFYDFEKITKVTEKTIFTTDKYGYTYYRKKDQYVFQIQHKYLFIVDNEEAKPDPLDNKEERLNELNHIGD